MVSCSGRLLNAKTNPQTRRGTVAWRNVRSGRAYVNDVRLGNAASFDGVARPRVTFRIEPTTSTNVGVANRSPRQAVRRFEAPDARAALGIADLGIELIAVRGPRTTGANIESDVTDRRLRRAAIRRARRHHAGVVDAREAFGAGSLRIADPDRRAVGLVETADRRIGFCTGSESNDTPTPQTHHRILPASPERWN